MSVDLVFRRQTEYTVQALVPITVAFLVCYIATIVVGVWYASRRHTEIIAARSPKIMLAIVIAGWTGSLLDILPALWDVQFYCKPEHRVFEWLKSLFWISGYTLTVWCCLCLISKFETQRLRMALSLRDEGFDTDELKLNWFQRNLSLLTSRFVVCVLVIISLIPFVGALLNPVDKRALATDTPEQLAVCKAVDQVFSGIFASLVALCAVLSFKIRTVQDAFQITV